MTPDASDRHVQLDTVHNFRDIGGYEAMGGMLVRTGVVFRADGLYRLALSEADVAVVRDLGIRTVIDLRSDQELIDRGRFPIDKHAVDFHHVPIIDKTWEHTDVPDFDNDVDFLVWAYEQMLEEGRDNFRRALTIIADSPQLPVVYHCAAGKDRTGLLTMLLLGILGVHDDDIVHDYALSQEAMKRMLSWLEVNFPEGAERMKSGPTYYMAAHPDAMFTIINSLREQHGTFDDIVMSFGLSASSIATLRSVLLV